jgi:hypothetical protein
MLGTITSSLPSTASRFRFAAANRVADDRIHACDGSLAVERLGDERDGADEASAAVLTASLSVGGCPGGQPATFLFFSSSCAHVIRQVSVRDDRWGVVDALGRGTWHFAPGIRTRHEIPSVETSGPGTNSHKQIHLLLIS